MKSLDSQENKTKLWGLTGMGITFASEVLAGALIGWGIDFYVKTSPWGLLSGCFLGILIAGINFFKNAKTALKHQKKATEEHNNA